MNYPYAKDVRVFWRLKDKALGLFYDNLQTLQNAIEYLKSKIPV